MTRFGCPALLCLLLSAGALAQVDGGTAEPLSAAEPPDKLVQPAPRADGGTQVESVAVLSLEANEGGKNEAAPVGALIASKLAEGENLKVITQADVAAMVSMERQKQLLGNCSEDSACLTELSGALGARYIVSGRIDKFGTKYSLTLSLFDAQKATALARPHADANDEASLPEAADSLAKELLKALGRQKQTHAAESNDTGPDIGLRIGNNFISGLSSLSPSGDLVLGYRFDPAWVAFLQVGFNIAAGTKDGQTGNLSVLPSVLGARHLYRTDKSVQPYWGVGLGVQLAIGQFGPFKDEGGTLPSVIGLVGVHWFITPGFAIGIEGSTNLAQTVLGLSGRNTNIGTGFNLKPALSFTFRP
ncbi:MAG: hypothetical protein ACJ790_21955 [Myxococcaceae bacterium]